MQSGQDDFPTHQEQGEYYENLEIESKDPIEVRIWRFVKESVETLIIALVLFLIIETVSARIRVDGESMEPSFSNGNFVIVNKLAYQFGDLQHGDVIVFPSPDNFQQACSWSLVRWSKTLVGLEVEERCPVRLIKRIIGLPGDKVRVTDGEVFVNDQLVDEPYINDITRSEIREVEVPGGSVYVMGDNRNNSSDSRYWGPLDAGVILGKAIFVYWPFGEFGVVEGFDYVFAAP